MMRRRSRVDGGEVDRAGAMAADPIRIGVAIERVTSELGSVPLSAMEAIGAALVSWWSSRPGERGPDGDKEAVSVRSFVAGELVLVAVDTRVANEMRYRRDELVEQLAALSLGEPIRRVRVTVRRPGDNG